MTEDNAPVVKDCESEHPIPIVWRPMIIEIVNSLVKKDYLRNIDFDEVSPVSKETADHIQEYIEDYGEELIPLTEETWKSSVSIWMETHWDILVDLWTEGEGRSDLVLSAKVRERNDGYVVHVHMVYVP